jgi:hypothetical protein
MLWQPGANSQSALRAAGPRSGSKPAHRSQNRNGGNRFPLAVPVFLSFSEVFGDPLLLLPGPTSCPASVCWRGETPTTRTGKQPRHQRPVSQRPRHQPQRQQRARGGKNGRRWGEPSRVFPGVAVSGQLSHPPPRAVSRSGDRRCRPSRWQGCTGEHVQPFWWDAQFTRAGPRLRPLRLAH